MMRGQVVPEEARAWTAGLLLATDYFAHARREAVAKTRHLCQELGLIRPPYSWIWRAYGITEN